MANGEIRESGGHEKEGKRRKEHRRTEKKAQTVEK